MKPTKWAETIVWQAYPECKPEKDGWYFTLSDEGGVSYKRFLSDEWEHEKFFVIAFAELPTGLIGDEFGFETALLLMKEGEECECATWGNTEFHEKWMFYEGDYCIYSERYNGYILASPEGHAFGVKHINGKWRLA